MLYHPTRTAYFPAAHGDRHSGGDLVPSENAENTVSGADVL